LFCRCFGDEEKSFWTQDDDDPDWDWNDKGNITDFFTIDFTLVFNL
jgi:hypothetical protein